ncbi:SURF1 family protein [Sphingomonas sp. GCM10030256]|uniref:SURF1 family protein n=1 Tax=Sphingomonas sp. GCM10030256 TaxID=3273427 RepID=UPI0036141E54
MTHRRGKRHALLLLCLLCTLLFGGLGIWQVERRAWKLDLIARVNARLQAAPVAVPPRRQWAAFDAAAAEYSRVKLSGRFLHDRETLVQALTERGPGFWVMTPLETPEGIVLVNRGFVPPDRMAPAIRAQGQAGGVRTLTGLLRPTEPKGRFLRPNRPAENRWYSRDVAAIVKARGLAATAPFFVDAEAAPNPGGLPVGGMTVVRFRNTHLVYALTWFGLAALSVLGLVLLLKPRQAGG